MIDDLTLNKILEELFQLTNPAIDKSRQSLVSDFIKSTINGDTLQDYLVINCGFGEDRKGALIYILTNVRLLKIQIDESNISSSSPSLSTIINVSKELHSENRAQIEIQFQNDSFNFNLNYVASNQKINDFFQKVDLARTQVKS